VITGRRRLSRTVAFGVAAAFAVAGCSGAGHPPAGAASQPSAPAPTSSSTTTTRAPGPTVTVAVAPWRLAAPVSRAAVIADGSTIVVAGGITTGDHSTASVVHVDPTTGTVHRAGALAQAVHDTGGAKLAGAFYVFGGGAASTYATVQRFTNADGTKAGALPKARSDHNVVAGDAVAYVVAGFDGKALDADVLTTKDGKTFDVVGQLARPVRYGAAVFAGGALWVIGGSLGTSESSKGATSVDTIQRFDPTTGTTSVAGHLPTGLSHACAFALGNDLYVLGGRTDTGPSDQILRIDTATGAVTVDARLPAPRTDAGVVVIGNTAWVVGGETIDADHPLDTVLSITARP
jgi:hypothetical protein